MVAFFSRQRTETSLPGNRTVLCSDREVFVFSDAFGKQ